MAFDLFTDIYVFSQSSGLREAWREKARHTAQEIAYVQASFDDVLTLLGIVLFIGICIVGLLAEYNLLGIIGLQDSSSHRPQSGSFEKDSENTSGMIELVSNTGHEVENSFDHHRKKIERAVSQTLRHEFQAQAVVVIMQKLAEELRLMRVSGAYSPDLERRLTTWAERWMDDLQKRR